MNVTITPVGMLGTNCYLLSSESKSCVLIDPGAQPEKIASILEEGRYALRSVLLTHGHWDHIGALKALIEQYPQAKCYIGANDKEMLTDPDKSLASMRIPDVDNYLFTEALELREGDELELDELVIKVMETPGHTLGSVCYICGDAIFSGDTLFLESVGRCDLYGGNFDTMRKSLKKLTALDGDYTVYPGHGESTSLEHERKNNPYILQG